GILLWGNHSYISKLFVLQKRAVRIIDGVPGRYHCKLLFIKYGILTLPSMYILSCLMYVKVNLHKYNLNCDFHCYSTRNRNNLYPNKPKYEVIRKRFDTVPINLFNSIPTSVKHLPEKNSSLFLRSKLTANPLCNLD
ncbi:hypothetical protein C0J52_26490, partial [Blattella germanica]